MNLHKYSQPPILYVDSHVYKIDLSQVKTSVFLEAFFFFRYLECLLQVLSLPPQLYFPCDFKDTLTSKCERIHIYSWLQQFLALGHVAKGTCLSPHI